MSHRIEHGCDGCGACQRQCPTGAIGGVRHQRLAIDPVLCIDCGVCGLICPRDAVRDELGRVAARVPRAFRERPRFDPRLCNGCRMCVEACPFDCISVEGPVFRGLAWLEFPGRCVSCGECEAICIKGAVRMRPADLRVMDPRQALREARRVLELAREPAPGGDV